MSRHGSSALVQKMNAVAQRGTFQAPPLALGVIASFDPATHMATATLDYGNGFTYTTPPSQLMVPWHGSSANGPYSDSGGPEAGQQCLVGVIDREANVFIILGFTPTDDASGIGVPAGEKKTLDKRMSFVHWAAARGGALRVFGNAFATVFGGSGTELGGENLDATQDAVVTKRYLDQRIATLQGELTTWAGSALRAGSGASGPTLGAVAGGSSLTRAIP